MRYTAKIFCFVSSAVWPPSPGGHDELVELLLAHGANCEHRDKKGCTPLILAASAGHAMTVAILLDHNADIEAQSDRTKDTALSLACSGGRQEASCLWKSVVVLHPVIQVSCSAMTDDTMYISVVVLHP